MATDQPAAMTSKPRDAIRVRPARRADIEQLARLWHEGWLHTHAPILPPELARHRTLENFRLRIEAALPSVRVAGTDDGAMGFSLVLGSELNQLYVADGARGAGIGGMLLGDAEDRLSARGVDVGWLACAIGNTPAAMFYRRYGWQMKGTMTIHLETRDGPFPLEVWRFEKALRPR